MDDDFSFTSVWGAPNTPSPITSPLTKGLAPPPIDFAHSSSSSQGDDDLDDFGTAPTAPSDTQDDDFGDFGDFGDANNLDTPVDFGDDMVFNQEVQITESEWKSLRLNPMPSKEELRRQVNEVLGPIWTEDISEYTTGEDMRQVEGVSQVLVTPESRDLYNKLCQSLPPTKPLNWTRSRIRQQHLISLGIPVNLDEVLPHANGKPLPPLQITTRPMSAPPDARNNSPQPHRPSPSVANSRSGSSSRPETSNMSQLALGPRPELNDAKVTELLTLDPQTLPLLPLATLERYLADLRTQTVNASMLLTHLLQTRDALQQDSETYNGLIAELVSEAQKTKMGKGKQTARRGSGMM